MRKQSIFIITTILLFSCANQKGEYEKIDFISKDVDNFYAMLSSLPNANTYKDTLQFINEGYLEKASVGLQNYFEDERKNNNRDIKQAYYNIIKSFPGYFESQKQLLLEARNHTSTYNTYFNKIKDSYPSADFPPTYLSIGFFNTQGRMIYPNTVFIGLEASIKTDSTNYKEFPENYSWLQREQASYKDLGFIIVHENLHTLQKNNLSDNSILNQAIVEGAAVFLTEYFCGKESLIGDAGINKMIDYAKANNKTLWIEFKNDLSQPGKFSEWFWNDDSKYPYSMGYYMGYMICKSYYENSANKKRAIKILIEAKESKTIYEQSKYSQNSM